MDQGIGPQRAATGVFTISMAPALDDLRDKQRTVETHTGYQWEPAERETWMKEAACLVSDPDIFDTNPNAADAPAKLICHGDKRKGTGPCPVQRDCLVWLLLTENPNEQRYLFGGGVGPAEREKLYTKIKEMNNE